MLKPIKFTLIILLFLIPYLSYALDSDRALPMSVAADSADINNRTGVGHYQGNVTVDQGSTHLRALNAVTYTDKKNQLIKGVANGDEAHPVHYWTLTDPKKPELHAYATRI